MMFMPLYGVLQDRNGKTKASGGAISTHGLIHGRTPRSSMALIWAVTRAAGER
jgi:hypothetical protein